MPPWGNLFHWRDRARRVRWSELFDLKSLNLFVPVMEFEEFLKLNGDVIDQVVYLQHYAEGWKNGEWEERYDVRECINTNNYYLKDGDMWLVQRFWILGRIHLYFFLGNHSFIHMIMSDLKILLAYQFKAKPKPLQMLLLLSFLKRMFPYTL